MGDLLGFEGLLNESAPFRSDEHKVVWKHDRRYLDFSISDTYNETCNFPRFWNETGFPIDDIYANEFKGCYDSDFDQVSTQHIVRLVFDHGVLTIDDSLATRKPLVCTLTTVVSSRNSPRSRIDCENGFHQSTRSCRISLVW